VTCAVSGHMKFLPEVREVESTNDL